ncbi:hypothetical protein LP420_32105 [Massilia sp. B-10]|nr:hypothetical protein LP420_32105 [Massilia sp. B-10]
MVKQVLAGLLAAIWMAGASAANVAPTVSITAQAVNANFVALSHDDRIGHGNRCRWQHRQCRFLSGGNLAGHRHGGAVQL